MAQLIASGKRTVLYVFLFQLSICATFAQQPSSTARCQVTSTPLRVRASGITERVGDIRLTCSGANPGSVFNGNFSLFLPVNVTNRVDSDNLTRDAVLSVDLGSGFVPTGIAGQVSGGTIAFNGVSYTVPDSGNIRLQISNVRAAINQLGAGPAGPGQLIGLLSSSLALDQSQVILANSQPGVLSNMSTATIACAGSPAPDTLSLAGLFAAGTIFASTRITKGYASAFEARSSGLDTGTRILVRYTDFPAATRIFVPDMVAGSDALQPTAGGDLDRPQAVGQYLPGSGTLLLVRVQGADATGAGGLPVNAPQGSGPVTLGSVSEVALTNGAGYVVYEVAATNSSIQESAQFPTFFSLPAFTAPAVAQETVAMAPVSSVYTASATAPVPRFAATAMQSDCSLLPCVAPVVRPARLFVEASPIRISAVAAGGAATGSPATFRVHNAGDGSMDWSISVIYQGGKDWLAFDPPSGTNEATVKVTVNTATLTAGTYLATVIVNGGAAGSQSVPVILTVTAPPPPTPPAAVPPTVVVSQVLNAATLQVAPLVPGSLATLMGSHLSGKSVSVTFDGTPATVIYSGDKQINLQVPASLGSKTSATLVVTVDGESSTALAVPLAVAWPAVFPHGVLNQNNQENSASAAAKSGDILQIFATGIPRLATVSVQIGDRKDLVPVYAGEAPTAPGVQQVNVAVPQGVAGTLDLLVCATTNGRQYCSPAYSIAVQ